MKSSTSRKVLANKEKRIIMNLILIGLGSLVIGAICGLLGAYAGADGTSKAWRRYGIPLVLTAVGALFLHWWALLFMFLPVVLSRGYGIPDPTDEGSTLGKFFYKIVKGNSFLANLYVRSVIGLGLALPLL